MADRAPSSNPSLLVLAGLLGAALVAAFRVLPPSVQPDTVAAGLAHPRAERDALCRDFAPNRVYYADLIGLRVGPPPRFEIAHREIMGGVLERHTLTAEEAVEALRFDPFPPFASSAEQLLALARRVARLGATRAERWPLLGDDDGYHGGLGILLREEGAFAFQDGWLVCAPAVGTMPTRLVEQRGCVLLEEGEPGWYRCPL